MMSTIKSLVKQMLVKLKRKNKKMDGVVSHLKLNWLSVCGQEGCGLKKSR